jgi:catalase
MATRKSTSTSAPMDREAASVDHRGNGNELHQSANGKHPPLTTNQGTPVSDNQNSLRVGNRGPTLLEDFILREKITHFDHERIPERIVHARGSAAHGYFELTKSLKQYTTAKILTETGKRTPLFTRISTVAGGAGSIDTPRDVRGFAVKVYTDEGNWDLVGNNIPVFFIQDAIKFPDLIHAVKMEPHCGFPQAATAHDTFWDFISLTPESMHMIMWAMSDRTRGAKLSDGKMLAADGQLAGTPSVIFDAVALVLSDSGGKQLAQEPAAVDSFAMRSVTSRPSPPMPTRRQC